MKQNLKKYYAFAGFLAVRTNKIFGYDDIQVLFHINRLSKQHNYQCVNACNGNGYVPRRGFFSCAANDTDKHETRSAYINGGEETIFDLEIKRLEDAMLKHSFNIKGFKLEFQHDPRGSTVKIYYKGRNQEQVGLTDILYL